MEEQFMPYEYSLKMKKLGFNKECLGYYNCTNIHTPELIILKISNKDFMFGCSAPLWQQAFDWFREQYNLYAYIRIGYIGYSSPSKTWDFSIYDDISLENPKLDEKGYSGFRGFTYEEARLKCLEKLIELIE